MHAKILRGTLLTEVNFRNPAMNGNALLFRFRSRYYQIDQLNIAYIYTRGSVNVIITNTGDRIPIHLSLIKLMDILDQRRFTRMAIDLIVSIGAIKGMVCKKGIGILIDLIPDLGLKFTYDQHYDRMSKISHIQSLSYTDRSHME